MRVSILETSVGKSGEKGYYNFQAVGLAKAFDKLFDEVIIYKSSLLDTQKYSSKLEDCKNTTLNLIPTKNIGINGLIDLSILDKSIDVLIYFSDTQLCVPKVYKWCNKNNIKFFPIIGVTESHSTNKLKRIIINTLFNRNLLVYKKSHCFVKTPTIKENLEKLGVNNITITPVGLDLSVVKQDYEEYDILQLKQKFGYTNDDKVVLYIARLIDEKQPLKMIDIFKQISDKNKNYKLLIVGTGPLEKDVIELIQRYQLQNKVKMIDKIPNSDIWQLYRIADCFVNLNEQEIFGMAILEAMYYGCKVVAKNAPGPSFIIKNGVDGVLCDTDEDVIKGILYSDIDNKIMHNKIVNEFTWKSSALKMMSKIK